MSATEPVAGVIPSAARRRYQRGSLFLRGKSWVGRWSEYEVLEDGSTKRHYVARVLGKKKEFPTKHLAQRLLQRELNRINDLSYRARCTIRFHEFVTKWEESVLPTLRPSTQTAIRSQLERHILPALGELYVWQIDSEHVQGLLTGLQLSLKTRRNLFGIIRLVMKTAFAWGYASYHEWRVSLRGMGGQPEARYFTLEQTRAIIEAAQEPYKTLFLLAAETGLRAGELCGLMWEDFDRERGCLTIHKAAWRSKLYPPKTSNAYRTMFLSSQTVEWLKSRKQEAGLLFPTKRGNPLDQNLVVKRHLHPILDQLKIPKAGLHALRHANASLMDRLSAPMRVRQDRLGHADPAFTMRVYTHLGSEDSRQIAEALGEAIHAGVLRPIGSVREGQS